MPVDITGDPNGAIAPSPAPAFGALPIIRVPVDTDPRNAASILQAVSALNNWVAWIVSSGIGAAPNLAWGDGNDGNVTLGTLLTLNPGADAIGGTLNYNLLDIGSGGTLLTRGSIIRVKQKLTIAAGGKIQFEDTADLAGGNNSGGTGGLGAAGFTTRTGAMMGTHGGNGGTLSSETAQPGGTAPVAGGGVGGVGGTTVAGFGAGGIATIAETDLRKYVYGIPGHAQQVGFSPGIQGLSGGTGGGGGGNGAAQGGGGGGKGGGGIIIFAREIAFAAADSVRSPGGVGGNSSGNGAGGGGGGGGYVIVVYGVNTGAALTTAAVPGGAGGTGSSAGVAGAVGKVVLMQIGV